MFGKLRQALFGGEAEAAEDAALQLAGISRDRAGQRIDMAAGRGVHRRRAARNGMCTASTLASALKK